MKTDVRQLLDAAPQLSVGVLSADLLRLGDELQALDAAGIQLVHVDVMDGVFCPQMTAGPPLVKAIPDRFVKDVHLMIDEPLEKTFAYVDAGAAIITFHLESTRHPHRVLQNLAGTGTMRGIALNPGTPLTTAEPLLDDIELFLILAVNPGWPGQTFIPATERKLAEARRLLNGRPVVLAIDGGITHANIELIAKFGADVVVSGTAIYDGTNPTQNARAFRQALLQGHTEASLA